MSAPDRPGIGGYQGASTTYLQTGGGLLLPIPRQQYSTYPPRPAPSCAAPGGACPGLPWTPIQGRRSGGAGLLTSSRPDDRALHVVLLMRLAAAAAHAQELPTARRGGAEQLQHVHHMARRTAKIRQEHLVVEHHGAHLPLSGHRSDQIRSRPVVVLCA